MEEDKKAEPLIIDGVPVREDGLYEVTFVVMDHQYHLVSKTRSMVISSLNGLNYATFTTHTRKSWDKDSKITGSYHFLKRPVDDILFPVYDLWRCMLIEVDLRDQFPVYNNPRPQQGQASLITFKYVKQYEDPSDTGEDTDGKPAYRDIMNYIK